MQKLHKYNRVHILHKYCKCINFPLHTSQVIFTCTIFLLDHIHICVSKILRIPLKYPRQPDLINLCKHRHFLCTKTSSSSFQGRLKIFCCVNIYRRTRLKQVTVKLHTIYEHTCYCKCQAVFV